jgi:hypothetical protein
MSENPAPYGRPDHIKPVERLARFLDGFLAIELLETIPCPTHLQMDYDDLDETGKKEWYEFTFHEVFRESGREAAGFLGRQLSLVELNLIKRRIINFLAKAGIEQTKE